MGDRMGVQLLVWEIYLSLTNHPGQLSLAITPWVGAMSTGQRAVMLCDWEQRQIWCCLHGRVTSPDPAGSSLPDSQTPNNLCDPYLSALEAFA